MQINNDVATDSNSSIDSTIASSYNTKGITGTESASATDRIDRLLTVQEVCELLSVKDTYIYWLTHQKKIPHIKMQGHLRFRRSVKALKKVLKKAELENVSLHTLDNMDQLQI